MPMNESVAQGTKGTNVEGLHTQRLTDGGGMSMFFKTWLTIAKVPSKIPFPLEFISICSTRRALGKTLTTVAGALQVGTGWVDILFAEDFNSKTQPGRICNKEKRSRAAAHWSMAWPAGNIGNVSWALFLVKRARVSRSHLTNTIQAGMRRLGEYK